MTVMTMKTTSQTRRAARTRTTVVRRVALAVRLLVGLGELHGDLGVVERGELDGHDGHPEGQGLREADVEHELRVRGNLAATAER